MLVFGRANNDNDLIIFEGFQLTFFLLEGDRFCYLTLFVGNDLAGTIDEVL